MDPVVIIGLGLVALLVLGRSRGSTTTTDEPTTTTTTTGAAGLRTTGLFSGFASTLATRLAGTSARAVSQTGYLGGSERVRMRGFAPNLRADGLDTGIRGVEIPWELSVSGPVNVGTPGLPVTVDDLSREDYSIGGTSIAFVADGDGVLWVLSAGSVGVGWNMARGMAWEHQDTGATRRASEALWAADAPRVVKDGSTWKLAGYGAAQLADGVFRSLPLARGWNDRQARLADLGFALMGAERHMVPAPFDA